MAIQSLRDVNDAYENGRSHVQRFYKAANVNAGDGRWQDWAQASGQPAYDARIGTYGELNQVVATGNDAIWFPSIPNNQDRHLSRIVLRTQASSTGQLTTDATLYDLVATYPLIDGDSTDIQEFNSSIGLPRYQSGEGIVPVLVNHVAPMVAPATGTLVFTNPDGNQRTVPFGVSLGGAGNIVSQGNTLTTSFGSISMPIGGRGCRSVDSIQFNTAPGGLFCIYMIKPIATIQNNDGSATTDKIATEKFLALQNGWHQPKILDGAHLGFFLRPNGGGRTFAATYGYLEFIWG